MSWRKAIILGFVIYEVVYWLGTFIFVGGLGYKYPVLANTFAKVLQFPLDLPTGVTVIISTLSWTLAIAGILKFFKKSAI